MREIQLRGGGGGFIAVVDAEPNPDIDEYQWNAHYTGGPNGKWYAARPGRSALGEPGVVYMHRVILGLSKGNPLQGDHDNGNTMDNRRENLRHATPKQNAANTGTRKGNRSGFLRVRQVPGGRWRAEDGAWGRNNPVHIGMFATAEEAAQARDAWVRANSPHLTYEQFNFPRVGERGLDGNVREA